MPYPRKKHVFFTDNQNLTDSTPWSIPVSVPTWTKIYADLQSPLRKVEKSGAEQMWVSLKLGFETASVTLPCQQTDERNGAGVTSKQPARVGTLRKPITNTLLIPGLQWLYLMNSLKNKTSLWGDAGVWSYEAFVLEIERHRQIARPNFAWRRVFFRYRIATSDVTATYNCIDIHLK